MLVVRAANRPIGTALHGWGLDATRHARPTRELGVAAVGGNHQPSVQISMLVPAILDRHAGRPPAARQADCAPACEQLDRVSAASLRKIGSSVRRVTLLDRRRRTGLDEVRADSLVGSIAGRASISATRAPRRANSRAAVQPATIATSYVLPLALINA
jgi:hypothetical protein